MRVRTLVTSSPRFLHSTLLSFALLTACGGSAQQVRPDDMSAEEHRREAAREHAAADGHLANYDPASVQETRTSPPYPSDNGKEYVYPVNVYDPAARQLDAAHDHRVHALAHEAAAKELESFEEAECSEFPPETRAACPILAGVTRVIDVAKGVRVEVADPTHLAALADHMRCHLAYARKHGYPTETDCPLYLRSLRIERSADGRALILLVDDASVVAKIRGLARKLAVPATDGHGTTL